MINKKLLLAIAIIVPFGIIISLALWWYNKKKDCQKKKEDLQNKISVLDVAIQEAGLGGAVEQEFQKAEAEKELKTLKC